MHPADPEVALRGGMRSFRRRLALTQAVAGAAIVAIAVVTTTVVAIAGDAAPKAPGTVADPVLGSISIEPPGGELRPGESMAFVVRGEGPDGGGSELTRDVAWASSDPGVLDIDDQGRAEALAPGDAEVTAELDGLGDSADVSVVAEPPQLVSVTIEPASARLLPGDTQTFAAQGTRVDESTIDLTGDVDWRSSDPTVLDIDDQGRATARASGDAEVTAELDGLGDSADVSVVAEPPQLVSVTIEPASARLLPGDTQTFAAQGTRVDESTIDLTGDVDWRSSDPTVLDIDDQGRATARASGDAEVTAELDGLGDSADVSVAAEPPQLVSVTIGPASARLLPGDTQTFAAQGTRVDESTIDLTGDVDWRSSDPTVLDIDDQGRATARASGDAEVTAELGDLGDSADVSVRADSPEIVSVVIDPNGLELVPGETSTLTAQATLDDDSSNDVTQNVEWVSRDTAILEVDDRGGATAVSPGTTEVTATLDGASDSVTVEVVPVIR